MTSYGQFCPVAKAAELFCERWTPLLIRDLAAGASRFSELHRGVPLMSPTLLSRRLRQLEAEGVIERRGRSGQRGCTYHLTQSGREFVRLVEGLGVWGQRWARRQLAANELDVKLLMWDLERGVRAQAFGPEQTVVRIEFIDQPATKRLWWFVNENGRAELCIKDPGLEVDLYLSTTLRDMIRVRRGDISLSHALAAERLEVIGPRKYRDALRTWLNLSPLAKIRSQRADAH
jgi:DNA-binding HxlR family transcriptional regulator